MPRQRSPHRRRRRRRKLGPLPRLSTQQILALADSYRQRTGRWPIAHSGRVDETSDLTWERVDAALKQGKAGRGRSSLAQFLQRHRKVLAGKDPLTEDQIFTWAEEHFARTGRWPKAYDGAIPESNGMTWVNVNKALTRGSRGLPGGSCVRQLLIERGAIPADRCWQPELDLEQIWKWARQFREKYGVWPRVGSGSIETTNETWSKVDAALRAGVRNLPPGSSLRRFLSSRGAEYAAPMTPLEPAQILAWADAFHKRWGDWPYRRSGEIEGSGGETWYRVDVALVKGLRDLPGGSSVTKLLIEHGRIKRGATRRRYRNFRPRLPLSQIRTWANAYRRKTGEWPNLDSGPIPNAQGLDWRIVDTALRDGLRGLPGGSSLCRMFGRKVDRRFKSRMAAEQATQPDRAAKKEIAAVRRKSKARR